MVVARLSVSTLKILSPDGDSIISRFRIEASRLTDSIQNKRLSL
jgi:hypothetical protein